MTSETHSRDRAYFEKLYAANPDPWNFSGSDYEKRKYEATMDTLGDRYFSRGLEVGCSIGVLTKRLANCCAELLAVDVVDQALAQARVHCSTEKHVTFERMQVPRFWPSGAFDLIVFSEILYFLDVTDVGRIATLANASLVAGGLLLLVNYTEDIHEPCSGEQAADAFIHNVSSSNILFQQYRAESFRIDLLEKKYA